MLYVGTCGWDYPHWRGGLYPATLPRHEWLSHYAAAFGAVEIDSTFYRLPALHTTREWAHRTPADFRFTVKASRYLTHVRRLAEPAVAIERLAHHLGPLGPRLGPLLVQLPPSAPVDLARLDTVLALARARGWDVAVEPRHASWFTDEFAVLLARYAATVVWTDWWGAVGWHLRTADWGYVRLHGGRAHPNSAYGEHALRGWVERVVAHFTNARSVFVMFNNDAHGCAPRNAARFAEVARQYGLEVARAPQARQVPLVA